MKTALHKASIVFFLLVVLFPLNSFAQDLTGIWKGTFHTETGENYRLEFQVEQKRNKTVTGVSYSYGEGSIAFYGKALMTGNYSLLNGSFTIQETKTVEVKSSLGATCLMNYRFTYSKSGKEEFLDGIYVGRTENRVNPKKDGPWGDCGGGTVHLRRVQNSDFYIEPFLRNKLEKKDTVAVKPPVKIPAKPKTKPLSKPVAKSIQKLTPKKSIAVKKPVIKKPVTTTGTKTVVVPEPKKDTITNRKPPDAIVIDKPKEKTEFKLPPTTRSRQNELVQTIIVTSPEVNVRFYDNGEIDGDSISVYLDGKLIVSNKGLSTVPIKVNIKMEDDNAEHVLVMYAENMGRIPPNTALMIIQDGDKRYQVGITTTEQKNAAIRFRYQKKSG